MNLAQRRKHNIIKSLYFMALLSFAVVVVWIGLEIYFAYTNPPEEVISKDLLEPIEVELYIDLATELEQRTKIEDQTLAEFAQIQPLIEPEFITEEVISEASNSALGETQPNPENIDVIEPDEN